MQVAQHTPILCREISLTASTIDGEPAGCPSTGESGNYGQVFDVARFVEPSVSLGPPILVLINQIRAEERSGLRPVDERLAPWILGHLGLIAGQYFRGRE